MNHSLGVPISRGFSRAGLNRNTERMRNVLKRHEVFKHMTDEEQSRALMVRLIQNNTDMQENMWARLRDSRPGACLTHAT